MEYTKEVKHALGESPTEAHAPEQPQDKPIENTCRLTFPSLSANESYARACAAAFCAQLDPTATELSDVKCAVSEAVTNAIVHGYRDTIGEITMTLRCLPERTVKIEIRDKGCGIADIAMAKTPLFTTDPAGERSGMGFTVMENFMDSLRILSSPGKGTKITMTKKFAILSRSQMPRPRA